MSSKMRNLILGAALFGAVSAWCVSGWKSSSDNGLFPYLLCRVAFAHYLHEDSQELSKEAASGESGVYYFTSYFLMNGMLSGGRSHPAAKESSSPRLMKTLDVMIATARPLESHGKTYQAWGTFRHFSANRIFLNPIAHYDAASDGSESRVTAADHHEKSVV